MSSAERARAKDGAIDFESTRELSIGGVPPAGPPGSRSERMKRATQRCTSLPTTRRCIACMRWRRSPALMVSARSSCCAVPCRFQGLMRSASPSSDTAPANSLSTSTLVVAGGVLLGHEVQAVAHRRDEGDVGHAVERAELVRRDGSIEVVDRHAPRAPVGAVDLADQALHLLLLLAVALDVLARGHRDLNEHRLLAPVRAAREQLADGLELER